ncbi:CRISPR-associated endonuclease Cas3'' [Paludisphaera mucosa]|uniref:CRISPR-associated endonuclease Cas3 n=1 Tax=Paludisphaera mucosa TaxID=3030827 RepID=A0ABT6F5H3_9BACT|nr:CRISPR-associated endonuclease Cas3'' [Paludisphaera mucosa]MDG3002826.1 CRISPR-associated endonuclease Cas3'' [Paludisphaera mucosa]
MKPTSIPTHFAHTLEGEGMECWQPLMDHLERVAKLVETHATAFDSSAWGKLAGHLHDLGKYAADFQSYLRNSAGDPLVIDASVLDGVPKRVDHSTAGAVRVLELARNVGRMAGDGELRAVEAALAMVIAGHHSGLPAKSMFESKRLTACEKQARLDEARLGGQPEIDALLALELPEAPAMLGREPVGGWPDTRFKKRELSLRCELWTRMLFSALIDADRLDTERFMNPGRAQARVASMARDGILGMLSGRVDRYLEYVAQTARARAAQPPEEACPRAESVLRLRADVLAACLRAAERHAGRHSLTVPTGGGKTLAALAFALRHAIRRKLRRVIVVIPFTSIIDQTAAVYRDAFGELAGEALVEHHSNLDPSTETYENRLASENWDAPVIVTTSVQFFESLFSARGTAARKLHNIAQSIVVFDEVQALPHHLRTPIFDVLNRLIDDYGVSALFCTATQPALDLATTNRQEFPHLPDVREVVDDVPAAFEAVKGRVVADFTRALEPTSWEDLAVDVTADDRVLTIVQRRDDARDLWRLMPAGTFHLSALMCPAHRRLVLKEIAAALADPGRACRVVSTTLVEAGVDLDFPVVYRALGGVDALAQAAGRCNRSGLLTDDQGRARPGRLLVFQPCIDPPPGLRLGAVTTSSLLKESGIDLFDPCTYERYFRRYFGNVDPDSMNVMPTRIERDFPEIEARFRMIDDQDQASVVVPYGEAIDRIEAYRADPSRWTLRALQPFIVNIPRRRLDSLAGQGVIETIHGQVKWISPAGPKQYHESLGLLDDEIAAIEPGHLIT